MIMAYKGFEKDLSCTSGGNRYQYREGVWNEENTAKCASAGFHCAENPLDCLDYYPDMENSAAYMAAAFRGMGNRTFGTFLTSDFWEEWFSAEVDEEGRAIETAKEVRNAG